MIVLRYKLTDCLINYSIGMLRYTGRASERGLFTLACEREEENARLKVYFHLPDRTC